MGKKLMYKQMQLTEMKEAFNQALQSDDKVGLYNLISTTQGNVRAIDPSDARYVMLGAGGAMAGMVLSMTCGVMPEIFSAVVLQQLGMLTGLGGGVASMVYGLNAAQSGKQGVPKSYRAFESERQEFLSELYTKQEALIANVMEMASSPGFEALVQNDSGIRKAFEKACSKEQMKKAIEIAKAAQPKSPSSPKKLEL